MKSFLDILFLKLIRIYEFLFRIYLSFFYKLKIKKMISFESIQDRFKYIYDNNVWSAKNVSGPGSEIANTKNISIFIENIIYKHNIKLLVDVPCGNFMWMNKLLNNISVKYIGLDIVSEIIEENKSKYAADKINFFQANMCSDPIPDCDLIIVRDCLFHLNYSSINQFLKNLKNTKYKYLITTTHINLNNFANRDIENGDFRKIDLFSYPFTFNPNHVVDSCDDFNPLTVDYPKKAILISKINVPKELEYS